MEERNKDLSDHLVSLRKRKKILALIVISLMCVISLVAYVLPSIYKSTATILIEQQEIPRELVKSTVTSYAAERIQTIEAQVMSRSNLFKIIDKFDLYKEERKRETSEAIIASMREDTALDVISAKVVDPSTGRPSSATIAFSLSYEGTTPAQVQKVVSELTGLYLNKNLENRANKASETSAFFKEEGNRVQLLLAELEEKLAEFKQNNAKLLPEVQQVNMQALQRIESRITTTTTSLMNLEDRKFNLEGMLAQIQPDNPLIASASTRLKILESSYATAASRYSDSHPDVIALKKEIDALRSDSSTNNVDAIAKELKLLLDSYEVLTNKYTHQHPDVVALNAKIKVVEIQLSDAKERALSQGNVDDYIKDAPDNPAYITISAQLDSVSSEVNALQEQKKKYFEKQAELEDIMMMAPQVEREYLVLKREYQNALSRNAEIKSKQRSADIAMQLESESKGERFTLIEPAILPEQPVSPNRPVILIVGFILSIGFAIGFAFVSDAISNTVRGINGIQNTLNMKPLSVLPYQLSLVDIENHKNMSKKLLLVIGSVIVFLILIVHFLITPLDVMWFRLLRKVDILLG